MMALSRARLFRRRSCWNYSITKTTCRTRQHVSCLHQAACRLGETSDSSRKNSVAQPLLSPGPPGPSASPEPDPAAPTSGNSTPQQQHLRPTVQSLAAGVYVDTHGVVKRLQRADFTSHQAEELVDTLNSVIHCLLEGVVSSKVSMKDLEVLELKMKSQVDSTNNELRLLEKSSVASLTNENEMLKSQIRILREGFKDEVDKIESGLKLDLNLEKSRLRDDLTTLDQSIKDTNNRIGTEVAGLKTVMESQKSEALKYLAGSIISMVTIILSVTLGLGRLLSSSPVSKSEPKEHK